jgi:hypothetical protein
VKTAFTFLFIALPLLFIAVGSRRFGFTLIPTLVASVAGEIFALALFFFYNKWKAIEILAGRAQAAVVYFPEASLSTRITGWLAMCGLGALIGVVAFLAHYAYARAQSAER